MSLSWESHRDITNVLHRFHWYFNAGRFDEMGKLFAHATLTTLYSWATDTPLTYRGEAEVADAYRRSVRLYDGLPRVQYSVSNVVIDGDEEAGTANVWSQYQGLHGAEVSWASPHGVTPEHYDAPPIQVFSAGRYEDTFERIHGAWSVTKRICHADFTGDRSGHMSVDLLTADAGPDAPR